MAYRKLQEYYGNDLVLRAVYYARVSTELEEQIEALSTQVQENKDIIAAKGWTLVDGYVDEGKSGTQIKRRTEYQRLLDDMTLDKFDVVVVKSLDRLNRNELNWYMFREKLLLTGKKLYLYLDGKFFEPREDGLVTGIKAIMDAQYSQQQSDKMNCAHKTKVEKMKRGESVKIPNIRTYGYKYVNGEIAIDEKEAEIVRLIYKLYLDGYGIRSIRHEFALRGIKNKDGREMQDTTIKNILKNERYKGTYVSNKTHYDFYTKKTTKLPESEWGIQEDCLPAIIDKADWEKAKQIRESRILSYNVGEATKTKGLNKGKSFFSGKVFCGECGKSFWRRGGENGRHAYYGCSTRSTYGRKTGRTAKNPDSGFGCDAPNVSEDELLKALENVGAVLAVNRDNVRRDILAWLEGLLENIKGGKETAKLKERIAKVERKKEILTDALLDEIVTKEMYKTKVAELDKELDEYRVQLGELSKSLEDENQIRDTIKNIDKELDEYIGSESFDKERLQFVKEHLSKIIVYKGYIKVYLDFMKNPLIEGLQDVKGDVPSVHVCR